jgi:hypothetical protein
MQPRAFSVDTHYQIETHSVVSDMKIVCGWADVASPLCIHFIRLMRVINKPVNEDCDKNKTDAVSGLFVQFY